MSEPSGTVPFVGASLLAVPALVRQHVPAMTDGLPPLYTDLASWFHLLTAPEEYVDEASVYRAALLGATTPPPRTLLELGAGGGNNASHLKRDFACTLVDLSPQMLELSRGLNPDCEHHVGDMRTVRLGRTFDCVFVHDAIVYMLTEADLRRAVETAHVHCKPGGVALFVPDCVKETFAPSTDHGGNDGKDGRALRYLQWIWDPDPNDDTHEVHFACILRDADGARATHDRHVHGLFPRATWLALLADVGFDAREIFPPADVDETFGPMFLCVKR